jgi:hypothetical protein
MADAKTGSGGQGMAPPNLGGQYNWLGDPDGTPGGTTPPNPDGGGVMPPQPDITPGAGGGGTTPYSPTALGNLFGNKLMGYLSGKAPVFNGGLYTGLGNTSQLGLNSQANTAMSAIQSGGGQNAYNYANELINDSRGPSLTEQRLGNEQYGVTAPGYETLRRKLTDDVTTSNLDAFNNSGMFGSDANQSSLAEGLGTALAGADMDQYRYGEGLRRSDLSQIEAAKAQRQSMGMGAAGSLGGLYQDWMAPSQTLSGVGQAWDADQQGRRLDEFDTFNRTQNADYNRFQELLQAFTGSQGNAGMQEEVPWWQQLLGYVGNNVGNAIGSL